MTGGKGVNLVYDPVGQSPRLFANSRTDDLSGCSGQLVPSLKCVAPDARVLVVGFAGGSIEKVS